MFRNKSLAAVKYIMLFAVLLSMALLSLMIAKKSDTKVSQKEETLRLNIQGKVNICLPDEK